MTAPKIMDVVSLDALLFAGLFFLLTMPSAYRLTSKVVEGWPQVALHGVLFYYLYLLFEPALPPKFAGVKLNNRANDSTRLGAANFNRSP